MLKVLTGVYYNDAEPFCCEVLRARIADGRLPKGFVDERSIEDVQPDDLVGYTQCHFFAGIGGFPLGLRLGGMPDDFPIWTGGFPCQGISSAGKGLGIVKDKRSALWWEWYRLIASCRPAWLLIENVPALRTRGVDFVIAALEGIGYEVSDPAVVGAWAVGAPHRRNRVWIVGRLEHAIGSGIRVQGCSAADGTPERVSRATRKQRIRTDIAAADCGDELADAESQRARSVSVRSGRQDEAPADVDGASERVDEKLADAAGPRREGPEPAREGRAGGLPAQCGPVWPARPGEPQHAWEAPRLVEFPLGGTVDGLPVRLVRFANRNALKAYGNAVLPQVVAAWAKVIYAVEQGGE